MRNYQEEFENRVAFIRHLVETSHVNGIVFGNSGGKDSALVGILCKAACENTLGIIMPCASKRNFGEDRTDGLAVADQFGIETRLIDLTEQRELAVKALGDLTELNAPAISNLAPRLRMMTLYAVAAAERVDRPGSEILFVADTKLNGDLYIAVSNPYNGVVREKNGKFSSTKADGHGIGLESVRAIVRKNNGYCNFRYDAKTFYSEIMLRQV